MCMHDDLVRSLSIGFEYSVSSMTYWIASPSHTHMLAINPQVSQEPVLFACSIRDNILYGAHEPTLVTTEEIEAAAKQVCLVVSDAAIVKQSWMGV